LQLRIRAFVRNWKISLRARTTCNAERLYWLKKHR